MKATHLWPLAALSALACGLAHADPSEVQEAGRLKVCHTYHGSDAKLEIPFGGKFVSATKDAPLITLTQLNFVDAANGHNLPGYGVETINGPAGAVARIDMAGRNCLNLDVSAPVSPDKNTVLPGSFFFPEWLDAKAQRADQFVYRYFTPVDSSIYIVSEVGKSLQYVVHDMTTGGHTNRDKFNDVPIDNVIVNTALAGSLNHALADLGQHDTEVVFNTEALGTHLSDADLKDGDTVAKAVAQFKKNVMPPPRSRIIVVVPHRSPVKVTYRNTVIYGSKVEGLGFYVDINLGTESSYGTSVGTMDVFLNCRISVIDVDSAKVLTSYDYAGGKVFPAARADNGSPFSALSDGEMFKALNYIAGQAAKEMLSKVLVTP